MALVLLTVSTIRRPINNDMSLHIDRIEEKLRNALKKIDWLESEVLRLKMLLNGEDIMKNSLSTPKDDDS